MEQSTIFYDAVTGKIYFAVSHADYFKFTHTVNIELTELKIDETIPINKQYFIEIKNYLDNGSPPDIAGNHRFYVDENGDIQDRTLDPGGWAPALQPFPF